MLKRIIIADLILLPLLLILATKDSLAIQFIGIVYLCAILALCKSKKGKLFVDNLLKDTENLLNKMK